MDQTRKKDDVSQNYKKYSLADIEWTLSEYGTVLQRYGYDEVYRIWIDSKKNGLPDQVTLDRVKEAMRTTRSFANWGELWTKVGKVPPKG